MSQFLPGIFKPQRELFLHVIPYCNILIYIYIYISFIFLQYYYYCIIEHLWVKAALLHGALIAQKNASDPRVDGVQLGHAEQIFVGIEVLLVQVIPVRPCHLLFSNPEKAKNVILHMQF